VMIPVGQDKMTEDAFENNEVSDDSEVLFKLPNDGYLDTSGFGELQVYRMRGSEEQYAESYDYPEFGCGIGTSDTTGHG